MSTAERTLPTPVFAVVGAGDAAVQEVMDAVADLRTRAEARRDAAQTRIESTRSRISGLPDEVPTFEELRGKLTADELRKLADPYIETATGLYNSLAERGESALARLRENEAVAENITRVEKVYNDAIDLTEDALGVVSSQTRAVGDRAAAELSDASDQVETVAEKVEETAGKVKAESTTAAQKVAGAAGTVEAKARPATTTKAAPAKKATTAKKAPARKPAAK